MLWIHGGSNVTGHKGTYNFSRFAAREQVVVVVINYRLGPFGWFVHPALNGADLKTSPLANFGTLDMVEALRWTQRNITLFGGDRDNVTIFGESAGGRNVFSLLASPVSEGLFHRAIAQSGHVRSLTASEAHNAEREFPMVDRGSWEVVQELGLTNARVDADTLRAVSMDDLLAAYFELDEDHIQPAVIRDDVVIPQEGVLAALADPRYAKNVPVMAGTTRDEVTLWLGLSRYFVDVSYPLSKALPAKLRIKDPALYSFWVDTRSRGWKLGAVDDPLSSMHEAGYTDLYAYRYDWDEQPDNYFVPFSEILGAAHASEIAFIMGAPMYGDIGDYMYPDTDSAAEMTEVMMTAWGAFARDGSPRLPDGRGWPRYHPATPAFMRLDVGGQLGLSDDVPSRNELLSRVASSDAVSELERCLLVWELLTAVGVPSYDAYDVWEGGRCVRVDAPGEKRRIREALEEEYGSVYFSG
jgi:para-nitrobenzyl esterase